MDFECQCFDNINALLNSADNTPDTYFAKSTSGFQEKFINTVILGQHLDVIDYISVLIKLELSDIALKHTLIRIINQLDLQLTEISDSAEYHVKITQFLNDLNDTYGAENIKNICIEYFTEISSLFNRYNIDDTKKHILWARDYIAEHYNEDISLNTITPHYFRHTFATRGIANGVSIKDMQELLGHSDTRTLMDVYMHTNNIQKSNSITTIWSSFNI